MNFRPREGALFADHFTNKYGKGLYLPSIMERIKMGMQDATHNFYEWNSRPEAAAP